ncbi:MAG: DUF3108 domain-containing protein [Flavobacteriales bacterium]|nr:DUF3108 domain-containing protein [Flavobacteriales bacterium]MDG1765202.1 DUF3108 domain-containing protein [Flavobacteriales bacterium]
MKKALYLLAAVLISVSSIAQSQKASRVKMDTLPDYELRTAHANTAFKAGEKLTYRIHYGFVDAGEAVIEVKDSPYTFDGREAFHIVGIGRSLGAFNWVFKVRDRYETYFDKNGLFPHRFLRDVNEGGYTIYQDYKFNQKKRAVRTHSKKEFATPEFVQDMLSSFYYARTLDYNNAKIGDVFTIMTYLDDEIFPLKIKYMGKEDVKMRQGTFRCLKFVPVIQEGRIFKDEEDMKVWITDDKNHIPIMVESKILVGSIKMEVVSYEGLRNPIAKIN